MTTPEGPRASDDAATRYWESVLGDGDADERMAAREQLATINERAGRYDAAVKMLIANVQDGAMSVELLEWLTRLRRAPRGDHT
jgi:hypothetical protein